MGFCVRVCILLLSRLVSSVYGDYEYDAVECECNSSFGYDSENSERSLCFSDSNVDLDKNSRWGWVLGSYQDSDFTGGFDNIMEWDLYSGAAQCDLFKGEIVASLKFEYDTVSNEWRLDYDADEGNGYLFIAYHVYIGNDMFPKNKKGQATVSPGQYTIKQESDNINGDIFKSFTGTIEAPFYVIVHAETCQCPHDRMNETTGVPTAMPTTAEPTTAEPTTAEPTTAEPTTGVPTTAMPTTATPTTGVPTGVPVDSPACHDCITVSNLVINVIESGQETNILIFSSESWGLEGTYCYNDMIGEFVYYPEPSFTGMNSTILLIDNYLYFEYREPAWNPALGFVVYSDITFDSNHNFPCQDSIDAFLNSNPSFTYEIINENDEYYNGPIPISAVPTIEFIDCPGFDFEDCNV